MNKTITTLKPFTPVNCVSFIKNLFTEPKYETLSITRRAWVKIMAYSWLAGKYEITGFGRIKDGVIIDIKIPKQTITETTAHATAEDITEFLRDLDIDEIREWELDWHSHVDMRAFISGTDEANYEKMLEIKGYKQFPVMITNKKGEYILKNFMATGKAPDIKLSILDDNISQKEIDEIYQECYYEVAAKLFVEVVTKTSTILSNYYKQNKLYKTSKGAASKKQRCSSCGAVLETEEEIETGLCESCYYWENGG